MRASPLVLLTASVALVGSNSLALSPIALEVGRGFGHQPQCIDTLRGKPQPTERADDAAQAEPAAIAAGAAGIGHEGIGVDDERVFALDRLDRQVRGVGDVDLDAVLAVLPGAGAGAAAVGLEEQAGLGRAGLQCRLEPSGRPCRSFVATASCVIVGRSNGFWRTGVAGAMVTRRLGQRGAVGGRSNVGTWPPRGSF